MKSFATWSERKFLQGGKFHSTTFNPYEMAIFYSREKFTPNGLLVNMCRSLWGTEKSLYSQISAIG